MAYRLLKLNSLSGVPTGYPLSGSDVFHATVGTGGSPWSGGVSLSSVKVSFNQLASWLGSPSNTSAIWISAGEGASTTVTLTAGHGQDNATLHVGGGAVFNENSKDKDFRIESNGQTHMLFVDGGNDRVGVLQDTPATAFDVGGTITCDAIDIGDGNITNVGNIALDTITADGSTITITGNTTFADGAYDFNVASHDGSNGLALAGTVITSTAAEINLIDGGTARGTTAIADGDGVLINDAGTMRMTTVQTLATYMESEIDTFVNLEVTTELQTALIAYTDGDNAITIANGGGITAEAGITSTAAANTFGATSFNDANITNVADIALDTISSDGAAIGIGVTGDAVTCEGTWVFNETSNDTDFRIESNGNQYMFSVDAGTDWVGVGIERTVANGGGTLLVNAGSTSHTCISSVGNIAAGGDVIAFTTSDSRLKERVSNISFPLEKIEQLNGVEFTWNSLAAGKNGEEYGVIAQDVEKVLPLAVTERYDTKYKAVRYEQLIPVLVEGVKELTERIKKLEDKV